MAYRFPLATLLRHRQRFEDARALDLAQALRRRGAAASRLDGLRRQAAGCRDTVARAGARGATGLEIGLLADVLDDLARRAVRAETELATARRQAELAREALVAASQGRRVIERLEALHREDYRQRLESAERRELDDVASLHRLWRSSASAAGREQ